MLDDRFTGPGLNPGTWATGWFGAGITPPAQSEESACYDPNMISLNNELVMGITPISESCGGTTKPYAGSLISSNGLVQYTYGFFEAKITLACDSSGQVLNWPAWWLNGQSSPPEIDIVEGQHGTASFHLHSSNGTFGGDASTTFANGGTWCGTHTFGAYWEPNQLQWYYDGNEVGSTTQNVPSVALYMVLTLTTDATYGGPQHAPSNMRVDYVRVWQ